MTIQEIIEMWNGCCSDGESGGGGGDFKTAKVTIVPKESTDLFGLQSCYDETEEYNTSVFQFEFEGNIVYSFGASRMGTALETTLIYSGDSVDITPGTNKVTGVSGDAVYNSETNRITITGDCTITGWVDE